MSRDPDDIRDEWEDSRDERGDDFRCHGCERPTPGGRLCLRCREEGGLDPLDQGIEW